MKSKFIIPYSKTDKILSEYFAKDHFVLPRGRIRISLLLAVKRDIAFLRGLDLEKPPLDLTDEQKDIFMGRTPTISTVLTYCSAIDAIARVMKAKIPPSGKNALFFKWSAKKWFGISNNGVKVLWELRNSSVHQYTILAKSKISPHGFNGPVRYVGKGSWEFNLNGMYTSLLKAIELSYIDIMKKSLKVIHKHSRFIYRYGFVFTQY